MGLSADAFPLARIYGDFSSPLPSPSALDENTAQNPSLESNSSIFPEDLRFESQQCVRRGPKKNQVKNSLNSHINKIARESSQGAYLSELASEQDKQLETAAKIQAERERVFQAILPSAASLAQINQGICALQGAFPGFEMTCSSTRRIETAAVLASGVRTVNHGIHLVVGGVATGVSEVVQDICAVHPIMQQKCHQVAQTSSQVAKAIEEFWTDSPAQQGMQYLTERVGEQYHKGISLFSEALLDEGYSFPTVIQHRHDLETLACAGASLGFFGAVNTLRKVVQPVRAQKKITVVSQVERPLVERPLIDAETLIYERQRNLLVRQQRVKIEQNQRANRLYNDMIANEQALLKSPDFVTSPFVPPKNFPLDREAFLDACQMHKIVKSGLGVNKLGIVSESLPSLITDNHMFFLIQRVYHSSVLYERKIRPVHYSKGVLYEERLDVILKEALNIAQKEADITRVSFAYKRADNAIATLLLKQGHEIKWRGSFSTGGRLDTSMEIMEIFFKKTVKTP